ncbi:nicotinate-nucleotide pyrophosphorylase [carboxylating] [Litorimonas taeanensis]|uniref:Probable nicotinate-nucleotide pyrophosphorylase [carboxylating] n=1 Tax=Litorimonas taeanensis TaxID=568099 RepID=A0A420WM11_9PROT|nr:carboxylating nicotinate-nucleotide diphosphorylase [Litorimonas taeanensis]RKQ72020.1 nicotinate-nucleotide pyrophosphorylase [carboxylating] [Litorimonas taeanensis]
MRTLPDLPQIVIEPIVRMALSEDFGESGDLTASLLVPKSAIGSLVMRARETGVIAGLQAASLTYQLVDSRVEFKPLLNDGDRVSAGTIIAEINGPTRSLLSAERVALNFLGRLSGVATLTRQYVDAVNDTDARIAATRKTTPGLRALEKQAVLAGGGYTHRESLAAAIMIKDNHIALAGGVDAALSAIKSEADHMAKVSVEVDTLEQLKVVLTYEPDVILLDNMKAQTLKEAVSIVNSSKYRRPVLEASGGVNLSTVEGLAKTGVNVISIGALTHSSPNFDIGMDDK